MGSSARRQAAYRSRMRDRGLVAVTVWVPAASAAEVQQLADRLAADSDLTVGPLRRLSTGRLEKIESVRPPLLVTGDC